MHSMNLITPVILCGGSGTRLWPRSRSANPKPFLPLISETTLFEETLARTTGDGFAPAIVVTGRAHLAQVEAQCDGPDGGAGRAIIVEPAAKNTAPAIALAAHRLPRDAVMLVCPSDHHIADPAAFAIAARRAAALACDGWLVAFGIDPTAPETGFGYIARGEPIGTGNGAYRIERFVEKPDRGRAEAFLAEGGYNWNGGIFCFTAGCYLDAFERHRPDMAEAVRTAASGGRQDGARFYPDAAAFERIDGESIDYAVMEGTDRAAMVPVAIGWSDIGNWHALREARGHEADADGNIRRGRAELIDCRNVMVESDGPRVSVIGLTDIVVVIDGDEILVTTHAGAQKVGKLEGAVKQ